MDTDIPLEKTAVNVDIDTGFLFVGPWKKARRFLSNRLHRHIPRDAYPKNTVIIVYQSDKGMIGTMETVNNCKTITALQNYIRENDRNANSKNAA